MKRFYLLFAVLLLLVGCSTLKVGDVSYNSFLSTTDTLTITKPDGSAITMKGKTTIDPAMLTGIMGAAVK